MIFMLTHQTFVEWIFALCVVYSKCVRQCHKNLLNTSPVLSYFTEPTDRTFHNHKSSSLLNNNTITMRASEGEAMPAQWPKFVRTFKVFRVNILMSFVFGLGISVQSMAISVNVSCGEKKWNYFHVSLHGMPCRGCDWRFLVWWNLIFEALLLSSRATEKAGMNRIAVDW